MWLAWAAVALALAPLAGLSDALIDALGLGESSYCASTSSEVGQLAAPLAGFAFALLATDALGQRRGRRAAVFALLFVAAFVAWWLVGGLAGECSFGGDD